MDFFSPVKAFRTFYDKFELGKAGPELELHRISYGYVSRVFEAAAEAVLALSSETFSSNTVRSICLHVRRDLISLPCSSAPCFNPHSNSHSKCFPSRIDMGTEGEDGSWWK